MKPLRRLVVVADDLGIGPETSRGILELASEGRLTATVLLVTSPYAAEAVRAWQQAGRPCALGWHACLTLDRPVLSPSKVPSLVNRDGRFWPLPSFLWRLACRRLSATEIQAELRAQLTRYLDLVGQPPELVNGHHHIHIFPPVGAAVRTLLAEQRWRPYVRRVREPWRTLGRVPGARGKRIFLAAVGKQEARLLDRHGFPGNDWLAGVSSPDRPVHATRLAQWLRQLPGTTIELVCHPGHADRTLRGRDFLPSAEAATWRMGELARCRETNWQHAISLAGFEIAKCHL